MNINLVNLIEEKIFAYLYETDQLPRIYSNSMCKDFAKSYPEEYKKIVLECVSICGGYKIK